MAKKPAAGTAKRPQDRAPVERAPDGTVVSGGGSLNPGGQPAWVREFREAFGNRCAPKAEQVLNRILDRALDTSDLDKALTDGTPEVQLKAEQAVSERLKQAGQAADTVLKYVLPKPTAPQEVTVTDKRDAFAGLTAEQLVELAKHKPQEGT